MKDFVKRIRRQAADWEKIFTNIIQNTHRTLKIIIKQITQLKNSQEIWTPYQRRYTDGK